MLSSPQWLFGSFRLDLDNACLWRDAQAIALTPKAFAVLHYLVTHPDRLVTKGALLDAVWSETAVSEAVLPVVISELRKALGDSAQTPRFITTVHRRGYRFVAPVTVRDQVPPVDVPPVILAPATAPALAPTPSFSPVAPAAVAELSGSVAPHTEGEYKPVSVLCCGLLDASTLVLTLGAEGLYRVMQTVIALAQEVLESYGGTITHHVPEGFTAVFGAPVAQEDHARRAVLAALDLHQRFRQHPTLSTPTLGEGLALTMGVHSGLVVVGGLGRAPQQVVTAVGAPTQVATRLQQQAAPGTLLVSTATYALVHEEVRGEPCGSLALDRQHEPLPVYTVQGLVLRQAGVPRRFPRSWCPFVGRQRELALLHDRLEAVRAGEGQVVSLVGPPGMGKTRLLTEFGRRVPPDQVAWYVGQCLAYGQATPYLPVRDIVQQVCALAAGDTLEARTAAVQHRLAALGRRAEEDIAMLLQLLDLPVAPKRLAQLSPETQQARTFVLLGHLIRHEAQRRPLVLAVENMHWIDPTSEAWLASLVAQLAGMAVLLLVTHRPGYQPPWGTHAALTQLALPPLRAERGLPADHRRGCGQWGSGPAGASAVLPGLHLLCPGGLSAGDGLPQPQRRPPGRCTEPGALRSSGLSRRVFPEPLSLVPDGARGLRRGEGPHRRGRPHGRGPQPAFQPDAGVSRGRCPMPASGRPPRGGPAVRTRPCPLPGRECPTLLRPPGCGPGGGVCPVWARCRHPTTAGAGGGTLHLPSVAAVRLALPLDGRGLAAGRSPGGGDDGGRSAPSSTPVPGRRGATRPRPCTSWALSRRIVVPQRWSTRQRTTTRPWPWLQTWACAHSRPMGTMVSAQCISR